MGDVNEIPVDKLCHRCGERKIARLQLIWCIICAAAA